MILKYTQAQLLMGANAVIVMLAIITLIFNIQQWRADWQLTHTSIAPQTMTMLNQNAALIAEVPTLHVFGKPLQTASDVPVSSLELRITGIAKNTRPSEQNTSKAYISISNQPSKIFHVGDTISFGVKLYDIIDDAVVVENNGRLEKLPLVRNKLDFKPRPAKEIN